ncbi:aminopeptidase N [bacterium BMS3Bbin10]|nr:aminopeptidase N [bacterium BMS3Bbin10]
MDEPAPQPVFLKDYKPSQFLIDTVALDVNLHPTATRVRTRLQIRPNPNITGKGSALVLDGEALELDEIRLRGARLSPSDYEVTDTALTLPGVPDGPFELEITTYCNPEANKALSGLYRSREIFCTQCEAQGFRRITYFLDRPDVLSRYTTRLQADEEMAPVLLANGNRVDAGKSGNSGTHFAVWEDPHPKPSYLFAMVGGALVCVADKFTTMSGRVVDLLIYVEPGEENRCAWAMESLKRSMKWDEERFGREYDLDVFMIVAVSDFNMGAMENKGLNIFNDKLILARPETATDTDYAAIEAVIGHEYFHNWTGNRVTCRDWFQLCLKEGLTVFRDQEFTSDLRSRPVERISDVRMLKTHQFPEDSGPLAHPVRPDSYIEINNFYTATVYEKGAELCRMIETIVGRDGFRKGMDFYFERHDGDAATVEDFIACIVEATGADLDQFMRWYSQAGTPEVVASLSYNAGEKTAELNVSQITPPTPGHTNKLPLHIPLKIGLLGRNGNDLPLRLDSGEEIGDGLIHLREAEQTFRFGGIPSPPVLSLLRGFSAPVKLTANLNERDLEFLMAHDSDLFNRWQAGQNYALRILTAAAAALREGEEPANAPAFAGALAVTLRDEGLEPAYRAEVLRLPSETDIAREIGSDVDPDAIHHAREWLRAEISLTLRGELISLYDTNTLPGAYSPEAGDAGKRALRNTALALLSASGIQDDTERVAEHYRLAANMTDKIAALSVLTHLEGEMREQAFADFFEDWKDDHLVIDKWFALQAMSSLQDAPERVEALTRHLLFSLKTPNKVRAVIGAFANMNPTGFHRDDGAGFRLVANAVLEIDGFNPQVSARILGAFKSWRMLEPVRRAKAKSELKRIASHGKLSRDLFEIVTKTLG